MDRAGAQEILREFTMLTHLAGRGSVRSVAASPAGRARQRARFYKITWRIDSGEIFGITPLNRKRLIAGTYSSRFPMDTSARINSIVCVATARMPTS